MSSKVDETFLRNLKKVPKTLPKGLKKTQATTTFNRNKYKTDQKYKGKILKKIDESLRKNKILNLKLKP